MKKKCGDIFKAPEKHKLAPIETRYGGGTEKRETLAANHWVGQWIVVAGLWVVVAGLWFYLPPSHSQRKTGIQSIQAGGSVTISQTIINRTVYVQQAEKPRKKRKPRKPVFNEIACEQAKIVFRMREKVAMKRNPNYRRSSRKPDYLIKACTP